MSSAPAAEASAAPPAKKGGALKLILALVVTAAAAGGGAFVLARKTAPAAPAAEAQSEEPAAAGDEEHGDAASADGKGGSKPALGGDYFSLDPSFVVNLNDQDSSRFLQIQAEALAVKPAALDGVRSNLPVIRNRLILLFSSQKYQDLLPREGKEKLQQQALDEINRVLDERKSPRIDAVVFTSFVMQ